MIFARSSTVLIFLAGIAFCLCSCEASEPAEAESYGVPEAEARTFKTIKQQKLAHLSAKKGFFSSLFARSVAPEPPTVHTLAPLEHHPIWKVHKYKGIELRPVLLADQPQHYQYSSVVQPEIENAAPLVPHVQTTFQLPARTVQPGFRVPHLEYGVPQEGIVDAYNFNANPDISDAITTYSNGPHSIVANGDDLTQVQILSGYPQLPSAFDGHSAGNALPLSPFTGFLASGKGLVAALKNFKFASKAQPLSGFVPPVVAANPQFASFAPAAAPAAVPSPAVLAVAVPELPEVKDVPVKGLENLQIPVPEIPNIHIPSYVPPQASGHYLGVNAAAIPLPTFNYNADAGSAAPLEQHQDPAPAYQEAPLSAPNQDFPPLSDSYGAPLPSDAYHTVSSDQVPSFTAPEPQLSESLQSQVKVPANHKASPLHSGTIVNGKGQTVENGENSFGAIGPNAGKEPETSGNK